MTTLPVMFGREEILMTGLTSRTTSGDVIYALLVVDGKIKCHDMHRWALFEKWRDVERRVPDRTKILKIWKSWRSEQQNVKFVIQKLNITPDFKPRTHRSKRSHRNHHKKSNDEEELTVLVHQVRQRENILEQQIRRMSELDKQIEEYETNLHLQRMHVDGTNYVQKAYEIEAKQPDIAELPEQERKQYIEWCEKILEVGEKLLLEEQKISNLSLELSSLDSGISDQSSPSSTRSLVTSDEMPETDNLNENSSENVPDNIDPWGTYVILEEVSSSTLDDKNKNCCHGKPSSYQNIIYHSDIATAQEKRLPTCIQYERSMGTGLNENNFHENRKTVKCNQSGYVSDKKPPLPVKPKYLSPKLPEKVKFVVPDELPEKPDHLRSHKQTESTENGTDMFKFAKNANRYERQQHCIRDQNNLFYSPDNSLEYKINSNCQYSQARKLENTRKFVSNLPDKNLNSLTCQNSNMMFEGFRLDRSGDAIKNSSFDDFYLEGSKKMSDNDSDTGLGSMHSSDMSTLETLV